MSILILEIPDGHIEKCKWLEKILIGVKLRNLIDQLLVLLHVAGKDPNTSLNNILSQEELEEVYKNGLSVLSEKKTSELLSNPVSLCELQEYIFVNAETGGFWDTVEPDEEDKAVYAASLEKTLRALKEHPPQQ